jgi:hypothetical protein
MQNLKRKILGDEWGRLVFIVFFGVFYSCLWLHVEQCLIYHAAASFFKVSYAFSKVNL